MSSELDKIFEPGVTREEQNQTFARLFDAAEKEYAVANNNDVYQYKLKIYRDWKNVLDYAYQEGFKKGYLKQTTINFLKNEKLTIDEIANVLNVSADFVLQIKTENGL